jgi:GMP reductase
VSDYDDVYVVPKGISALSSRKDVDLRNPFLCGLYPIISSPMKGISGVDLVAEMGRNNCLGILHRFNTVEDRLSQIGQLERKNVPFGVAIGFGKNQEEFNDYELTIAFRAVSSGAQMIVLDVANGYLPQHKDRGKILRDMFPKIPLMSGNVVTQEGAQYLLDCGFDYVRVGIGSGAQCLTRIVTGVGRNQLKAIRECSRTDAKIVSDGGINESGKAVKSFALGADFVMLGSILSQAFEAEYKEDRIDEITGEKYGVIYGMASLTSHLVNEKDVKSIEGRDTRVKKIKPLKDLLCEFLWGIRSACTYLNAPHYTDLRDSATIEENI